jgi:hypothetical protein
VPRTHRVAAADGKAGPPVGYHIVHTVEAYLRATFPTSECTPSCARAPYIVCACVTVAVCIARVSVCVSVRRVCLCLRHAAAVEFKTNCKVVRLITLREPAPINDRVIGLTYSPDGGASTVNLHADAVVLATGGFGFSHGGGASLMHKWAPWLAGLPTTNGPFAVGDGIHLAEEINALLVHMNQVRVLCLLA